MIALAMLIGLVAVLLWHNSQSVDGIDRNLLIAARGNKALAKRLLEHAKLKYPGKSDRWYVEKIIYDLERDGAGAGRRSSSMRMNKRELRENIFLAGSVLWLLSALSSFFGRFLR
jgi:hypothetical protein